MRISITRRILAIHTLACVCRLRNDRTIGRTPITAPATHTCRARSPAAQSHGHGTVQVRMLRRGIRTYTTSIAPPHSGCARTDWEAGQRIAVHARRVLAGTVHAPATTTARSPLASASETGADAVSCEISDVPVHRCRPDQPPASGRAEASIPGSRGSPARTRPSHPEPTRPRSTVNHSAVPAYDYNGCAGAAARDCRARGDCQFEFGTERAPGALWSVP